MHKKIQKMQIEEEFHPTKEEEEYLQSIVIQEILKAVLIEGLKEEELLQRLEQLSLLYDVELPSFEEIKKQVILEISKNKELYFTSENLQKEVSRYQEKITEEQKELIGKEKLEEAYSILQLEEEEKIEENLRVLQKKRRNPFYIFINTSSKKLAVILGGIVLIAGIVWGPGKRAILSNSGFFVKTTEEYKGFQLPKEVREEQDTTSKIETYYQPAYLLEGYQERNVDKMSDTYTIIYINEEKNNEIVYKQCSLDAIFRIDNIKDYKKEVIENKEIYYQKTDKFINLLYYNTKYQFTITSQNPNESIQELIKILNSLTPKEEIDS